MDMDVVDENRGSYGTSVASPAVGGRKPDTGTNRPSPAARKSSSKRCRRSGEGSSRSRRHTGDSFALADVLGSLASPALGKSAALDRIGEDRDQENTSAGRGSGKRSKRDRLRRTTADFSAINHLLDASVASEDSAPAAADSPREQPPAGGGCGDGDEEGSTRRDSRSRGHPSRASGGTDGVIESAYEAAVSANENGATADFSAISSLLEKGTPRATATGAGVAADAGTGGSPPDASAVVPRARYESSQKPGCGSLAEGLAEQSLSLTPGGSFEASGRGGDDGGYADAATRVPAAAVAERGRRPGHSMSRKTPPDNSKDLAVPTPEKRRREIPGPPSHQPLFPAPRGGGGAAEETGDVGDLLADLSESAAGNSARRPARDSGVEGCVGRGDGQHTAAKIHAVMAEFREGGGGGDITVDSNEESGGQIAAVDMDEVVAGLGQRGDGKKQAGGGG